MTAGGRALAGWLAECARRLEAAGVESPGREARMIARLVMGPGLPLSEAILAPEQITRLETVTSRRIAREPLSRIRGEREFYGRMFKLSPETLDPRPDTETLIEAVLQAVARRGLGRSPLRVLDLGTGTGAILVTLLAELPVATGIGTDLSEGAARTAEENAVAHGVAGRARFLVADWLTGVDGAFDLVVSNPPYIRHSEIAELEPEVTRYDPGRALDGGADGLDAYRRMLGSLAGHLAPGGMLFLEVGAGQAGDVVQLIETHGLGPTHGTVETHRDLAGHDRVVAYAAHCAMRDQITVGIERSSR